MSPKAILWFAVIINLAAGNTILHRMLGKDSIPERAAFHLVASTIAILMIVILFQKAATNARAPILIMLSLFGALSVPMITTFIITAGIGIHDSTPDALVKACFIAIISGISSWYLWVPFGVVNALLLYKYSRCNIHYA